jgi:predicted AAA+ superfamily ATPase
MRRYLYEHIKRDLSKKMVILTGPRQIGKTWLSKELMKEFKNPQYLNYDHFDDARIIRSHSWSLNADMLVLDEIHKMEGWKTFVKGVYDTRPQNQAILLTGSSRLETFRQTGESLAGRYFHFHLNPISVKEMEGLTEPSEALSLLGRLGGFPEPFLSGSEAEASRWRNQYYTDLIREDILEFSRIHEIRAIRLLLELLRERVGAPLSYTSLSEDLQISPNTAKKYIDILESLCIIFSLRPFHTNVARSVLKEPKIYFYDSGYVKGEEGIRFENTCAVSLLKHVQYLQDAMGEELSLHYIKTRIGKEVDFAIAKKGKLHQIIEAKLSDDNPSSALSYFVRRMPGVTGYQLVQNLRQEQNRNGIGIVSASKWLAKLSA